MEETMSKETLTEAQVERWRDDLIGEMWGVHAHAELNALCDLALAQIRGQEPVAWRYVVNGAHTLYSSIPVPDDAYDEGTLVPLFAAPQPAQEPIGWLDWPSLEFRPNRNVKWCGPESVKFDPIPVFAAAQPAQDCVMVPREPTEAMIAALKERTE